MQPIRWLVGAMLAIGTLISAVGLRGATAVHSTSKSFNTTSVHRPAPISAGDRVYGVLEVGDAPQSGGTVANHYAVDLAADQAVSFVAWPDGPVSPGVSLSISLWIDGTVVVTDDAGAGSGEREIVFTPKYTGTYVLRVALLSTQPVRVRYALQASVCTDNHRCPQAQ